MNFFEIPIGDRQETNLQEIIEEENKKLKSINKELLEACENLIANLDCYGVQTQKDISNCLENARNVVYKAKS